MTPDQLAEIHRQSGIFPRHWSRDEFSHLLNSPHTILCYEGSGFLLGRQVADEAEVLTLAVLPEERRQGLARRLLAEFEAKVAAGGALKVFLEVAINNQAAIALYKNASYQEVGLRKDYFNDPGGQRSDALVLEKHL